MNAQLNAYIAKVDAMSIRERALIFAALAFALVSAINTFFLDPLLAKQRQLSTQMVQQQEKMKAVQAQLAELLEAKKADENAPQRERIQQLKDQIEDGATFLKQTQNQLVSPENMASVLEQVLTKNSRLQLVELNTLPVSPLIEPAVGAAQPGLSMQGPQIYKHGVQMTVRGSYADLTQYLNSLEGLKTQMYWGKAMMSVTSYPQVELTLTLYTLSLDKTWLQV